MAEQTREALEAKDRIRQQHAGLCSPAPAGWVAVADDLPPMDVPVWLFEDGLIYTGCRSDGGEGWLWCNCYDSQRYDRKTGAWNTDVAEADDDYKPTHWMEFPKPPNSMVSGAGASPRTPQPTGSGAGSVSSCRKNLPDEPAERKT